MTAPTPAADPHGPESGIVVASLPRADGSTPPITVASRQPGKVDLVLEGGGVKGLGLVGAALELSEAGYEFNRFAGASAGAIVASLLAGLKAAGRPVSDLEQILQTVDYGKFVSHGLIGEVGDGIRLLAHEGLHSGEYLLEWLGGELEKLGVVTFADLAIDDEVVPEERRYSLVVLVSDITRGKSIRLPWEYAHYGLVANEQKVVEAVRASMSIPFFFTPWRVRAHDAEVAGVKYPRGTCTWVDGGMLDNFPIDVFSRGQDVPGRWPTIGVKLSALGPPPAHPSNGVLDEARACLETMLDNADRFYVIPADAQRTIFVDHGSVRTTDFGITPDKQELLLTNGRKAARAFLAHRPAA
jgi:NTE family protein